jgi:hypothetical protein
MVMIMRIWHGWTRSEDADTYERAVTGAEVLVVTVLRLESSVSAIRFSM